MTLFSTETDPFTFHRLALLPLVASDPRSALETVKLAVPESKEKKFLTFLMQNGLGPLWHETLNKNNVPLLFTDGFTVPLKQVRLLTTVQYLRLKHSLEKVGNIFRENALPHAVFKGAHIRELIYKESSVRPACDIDILVSKEDTVGAIKKLVAAGLTFQPLAKNISHEATLADGNVSIDLHWEIMRPGRTRIDLTDELLATRKVFSSQWGLSHEATVFIMLVHPVFTKYGTAPQASLVRLVDLTRWIQTFSIDWAQVLDWLKRGGVQTAAWITAEWLKMLTGVTLPESFEHSIKPSAARTLYLQQWLNHNLASRLLDYPILIQAGFTLPAHDRITDAWHAILTMLQEKKGAVARTTEIEREIQGKSTVLQAD